MSPSDPRSPLTERGNKGLGSTDKQTPKEINTTAEVATEETDDLLLLEANVKGRTATVLIDSGASGNFINRQLVEEAKILTAPSKVSRTITIADGRTQQINETAYRLLCKIGDYREKHDLDIANTPNYGIILGKPWLAAKNPDINWRKNTITFEHQGHTITLNATVNNLPSIDVISAMQFRRIARKAPDLFMCVIRNENEETRLTHSDTQIQNLLHEYKDVFPEDIPKGLPPSRSVDHRIALN